MPSPSSSAAGTPADADWPPALLEQAERALPAFLMQQRWYPAKDAGTPAVSLERLLPIPVPGVPAAAGIWTATPPGQAPIRMLVALAQVAEGSVPQSQVIDKIGATSTRTAGEAGKPQVLAEAFAIDDFVRAWADLMLRADGAGSQPASGPSSETSASNGSKPRHDAQIVAGRTAAAAKLLAGEAGGGSLRVKRSAAEQSNTSIRLGDGMIMKAFRRLQDGTNPELEVCHFLTQQAGFAATPALLGWISLEPSDRSGRASDTSTTLTVLQSFVPNEGDGWEWLQARLAAPAPGDRPQDAPATGPGDPTIDWLRRLGRRTAEMHQAFGIDSDDAAFRPEPVVREDLETWAGQVRDMARRALDGLAANPASLQASDRRLADELRARASELEAMIDRILTLDRVPAFHKTRHHGDFHLGQVLVADGDAMIVDFEGEPMRPREERRAKHAPLRDVAGLLRSIAYAAAAALRAQGDDERSDGDADRERLADWERRAEQAYLDAYLDAARDVAGCPKDRADAERVIRFFMLEKAFYEVNYELANRPDWVGIPLAGVLAQLSQLGGEAQDGPARASAMRMRDGSHSGAHAAPVRRAHVMPFGAELREDGTVRFNLWAPSHAKVEVLLEDDGPPLAMHPAGGGWHELTTGRARAGTRYRFLLPDGTRVPDPGSRYQPEDVHGPSEVIDPRSHAWQDAGWRGRRLEELVVYELHVGAFTPEGTFRAAIGKLDHLVELGVTAIEVMPVADFPGARNWGYDGVLPYAPDGAYGRPEDLKALVDAAHARGLAVLLDVVYNHFGPEGAYLHAIAPEVFTDRHDTPWGKAINLDGPQAGPVREFFIENACYWLEEFHLDGLRFDAVHALIDDGERHLLQELAERVRASFTDRPVHLILENEENAATRLVRNDDGTPRWYSAQWNDDVHHVLHTAVTSEADGYYADYLEDTEKLGRALAEGFAFQGEHMPYRGEPRGEPSAALPPTAFVAFIQNHDQVGNRAFGDRLNATAKPQALRAAASVYLLLPQIPMLFMGEEWAAAQPFPFFCDFGAELADAVREGRRNEFARFPQFADPEVRKRIPDPTAEATFASAKLAWDDRAKSPHAATLAWYRRALAVRHAEIVPRLSRCRAGGRYEVIAPGAVVVRWDLGDAGRLVLEANLSGAPVDGFPAPAGRELWCENPSGEAAAGSDAKRGTRRFGPWMVRWSLHGGDGGDVAAATTGVAATPVTDTATFAATATAADTATAAGSEASALERLALRMGIEPSFRDAHGKVVRTGDETRRKLLAAMGLPVADESKAAEALATRLRADWLRPLPPVAVAVDDGSAPTVEVALPSGVGEVAWRLRLEDGGERTGQIAFDRLTLVAAEHIDGRTMQRRRLTLPRGLPWGYHRLELQDGNQHAAATTLVLSPGRCWLPPPLEQGHRLWGIAVQLYLLREDADWGIGDFGHLRRLVEIVGAHGGDIIGLNPLHAMFHDNPAHASPYSPASRLLLNLLYIDVPALPELLGCPQARTILESARMRPVLETAAACRREPLLDYDRVTAAKLTALEAMFEACRDSRREEFEAFRREQGDLLERHVRFLALREHFARRNPALADWHAWPEPYRDPDSPPVARFAQDNADRITFLAWLQWLADLQLGEAAARAKALGLTIGLYRDLAVGADRSGAETWANAAAVISGAQVGAPPDIYNPAGQDWGLPPFHPDALREEAYRSFVQLVRANMRHAAGLRIDHVMGLQHLYWVPQGATPSEGAYVAYPLDDMIAILALESHRQRCLVVGEDLGTVPEGFRERMAQANVLSYRVLFFEREEADADGKGGGFLPPDRYPELAMAVAGSHDLPTLRGWWEGRDIDLRERLGAYPAPGEAERQRAARERDRALLLAALRREGLLPAAGTGGAPPDIERLTLAAHAFLASTPSMLALLQVDDLAGESEPVNLPATSTEHPNWRRRQALTLEELAASPALKTTAAMLAHARATPGVRTGSPGS